ncbi:frequenin [Pichia kluyveri]|uniref:Calcium-binding protein NCS-1 n=1 Tax=Pichia kluyveri TaxID=36015 RepID=A0AAV5QXX6_PICKL|nr:frequenin [Pichia kluyveri]
MGQKTSKLSNEDITILRQETKFSTRELHQWYKGFKRDINNGELTKEEFIKIHKQFYPFGDPTEFAAYAFEAFNINNKQSIDFKDFIKSLSIATRGSIEEKLKWAFKMYDRDNDGYISYMDLLIVVKSVYKMIGTKVVKFDNSNITPELKADKIWIGYHKNLDNKSFEKISIVEFSDAKNLSSNVINAVNIYNDII